ncbi:MAG: WD40/YVTN/BNR-like repeat-containing protein, partial [Bacillota bacterium]
MQRRFSLALFCLSCLGFGFAVQASAEDSLAPLYGQMQWRLVGPFRGGWSTMVEGVPGEPNTFYFGGADGGVWKTEDAGLTWKPQFQDAPSISIGALAIAPSNPKILYIGTGQPETRYDIVDGDGVYRSDDGGETWKSVGLADTRHIGRIWVDPRNPDVVLVAALGHIFGPNEERGLFRSEDGGAHWSKVLYVDADTGAVDIAADPAHPDVLFASTWAARNYPFLAYYIPDQGAGSGIWKSVDGGKTWTRLVNGIPAGALGRIGLAVAPGSNDQRVYAAIESADEDKTGLYRSDDGGASWKDMGSPDLVSSYFDRLAVDPKNPDELYVVNRSVARSVDGGKSFTWFKGAPGGDDYHFIWINPLDASHMAVASDQGTSVSVDGGKTWSEWYNQPTGQFYHVATDDRFPYHIYSGQQDSGTVETESSSDYGEITFRDWNPVGGDERSYVIPDNGDPDIVYVGGLGGHVSRFDKRTGQVQNVSAWPVSSYARRPTTVQYRYNWFYPLVADPHKAHTLYLGSQYVWKTTDGGLHWKTISPDLTGKRDGAQGCDAKIPDLKTAKDCGYGTVFTIAPSPRKDSIIWAGADDGVVSLTRDGGRHWEDVTPKDMPLWGRVNQVEASPSDPATAYAAVDLHRQDIFAPYIYRTHDYGKTWESITTGIPASQYVYVVRQDPQNARLLYAGTNAGVYVSFDDGDRWQPLQLNLPTARVRDLAVHGDDLIAGTQGRAIWVLDDVTPLRQAAASLLATRAHLFAPAMAVRVRRNENKDTPLPPEIPAGQNAPEGAILDYWVGQGVQGPVTLIIYDAAGKPVRQFSSDAKPQKLEAEPYFSENWLSPPESLPGAPGAHRFVWNLRYPRPLAVGYDYSIAAVYGQGGLVLPEGPLVLPGRYTVKLTAGGETSAQSLMVALDPRVSRTEAKGALAAQLKLLQDIAAD